MADSLSFSSEQGNYTDSDMEYTYGDARQKMLFVNDDLKILAWKLWPTTFFEPNLVQA